MDRLTSLEITSMLLALGILLTAARALGELFQRFNQPAVLGELLAGILLGPTVLGRLAPGWVEFLFPPHGRNAVALDGLTTLAIVLFLLVAGMEVDLSSVWRQGKTAISVGIGGIIAPFAVGFGAAWTAPILLGRQPDADPVVFALFFATALSISALPVIAKTLMDLALYRSDMGMIVIAAAIFNDLIGWIIFAIILGMIGTHGGHGAGGVGYTIVLTIGFVVAVLTVGRWLVNRALLWLHVHTTWPGGVLGFALSLALFGAAFTEWIGIHAIFGSFLVGIAIGDSPRLREKTRATIAEFISFIFAPLFFASIGLKVDFIAHFRLVPVVIVLLIACIGKMVGCGLAARLSGMNPRESLAVGAAMNARGTMEIILGMLALQYGIIQENMFVSLVVMALVTSVMSGPLMKWSMNRRKRRRLLDYVSPRTFIGPLDAATRWEAIRAMSHALAAAIGTDPAALEAALVEREQLRSTGLGNGVAIPHVRTDAVTEPVVGVGLTRAGIDFDAADGEPAQILFLLLTPLHEAGAQIDILSDIARSFQTPEARERAAEASSYFEFVAALKTQ